MKFRFERSETNWPYGPSGYTILEFDRQSWLLNQSPLSIHSYLHLIADIRNQLSENEDRPGIEGEPFFLATLAGAARYGPLVDEAMRRGGSSVPAVDLGSHRFFDFVTDFWAIRRPSGEYWVGVIHELGVIEATVSTKELLDAVYGWEAELLTHGDGDQ